jgi:hypothetical protein
MSVINMYSDVVGVLTSIGHETSVLANGELIEKATFNLTDHKYITKLNFSNNFVKIDRLVV